jgi:hypothetical protein
MGGPPPGGGGGGFGGPPPGGMGGPPPGGGFGAPAATGAPAGFGAPPGGPMVPAGGAAIAGAGAARNPTTITLISMFCCFYYGLFQCMKTEEDLNKFLGKSGGGNILWMLFPLIPALSMPKLISEARARAGTATQGEGSLIMYILLPYYAFIKDANEVLGKSNGLA